MIKTFYLLVVCTMLSACGTMQSIVKSSFPYTTILTIPANSDAGKRQSTYSTAKSFDLNFFKKGNSANKVNAVRIISAKLQAVNPSDYNIGQIEEVEIFMSKNDGRDEEMVASRKNINLNAGNMLVLDIDNGHFLDDLVREPSVRVRMAYKLRNKAYTDINLHVILSITAYPNGE